MRRKLKIHDEYMADELARLENTSDVSREEIERLNAYHQAVVRDLQHERLIHLIVTLFFAVLMVAAAMGWILTGSYGSTVLTWGMGIVSLMLLVVELAYVLHYYLLENGVQKLYEYTGKLHELEVAQMFAGPHLGSPEPWLFTGGSEPPTPTGGPGPNRTAP